MIEAMAMHVPVVATGDDTDLFAMVSTACFLGNLTPRWLEVQLYSF